ncbi:EAL domain-containing protein [Aliiruegeria lutimaris]|uniref:PAS domain S-box-containing protein/diguanylate cyclase (GGDEF) domain-containing protein n=1 Tax=Aliiruegeria lutimaris TaxID=571298 RepID=A0A1G8RY21_9RHOB|nr:EAL domain-containing protein [Aliiruegeria lutimaris]SDJ21849.1 PAS domain S-box-containing protein/diguanylate cyclase (GGDEF) domain-containing protein [Aliiruegeria lutimaris]
MYQGALGPFDQKILFQAAKHAGFAQWFADPRTRRMWATEAFYDLLGFDPLEVSLDHEWIRKRLHPDDAGKNLENMRKVFFGENDGFDTDFRLMCKDRSYKWFHATARLYEREGSRSEPIICGNLTDISHRKETEKRLRQALSLAETAREEAEKSEDLLLLATENAGISPWLLNPGSGTFIRNKRFKTLSGMPMDGDVGHSSDVSSRVHPDDIAAVRQELASLLCGHKAVAKVEHRLRHEDGHYVWCSSIARLLPGTAEKRSNLICGVTNDISERIAHEVELNAALRDAQAKRLEALEAAEILRHSTEKSSVVPWYRIPETGEGHVAGHLATILGFPSDFEIGFRQLRELLHPDDAQDMDNNFLALDHGEIEELSGAFRLQRADGSWRWFKGQAQRVDRSAEGLPIMICGSLTDIDELKQNEVRLAETANTLRRSHEHLTLVADVAPVGLYEFRLSPDGRLDFPYCSGRFADFAGVDHSAIMKDSMKLFSVVVPEDIPPLLASVHRSAETLDLWQRRFRIRHPERDIVWLHGTSVPRKEPDGTCIWTGAFLDVTADVEREQEQRHAHLLAEQMRAENERQALHDGLTGLPNRRFYDRMIGERLERARSGGPKDAVLIRLDLDHFKHVNDTLGHEAGDAVLAHVAEILGRSVRSSDFAARIGGDEFSILMAPGASEKGAREIVKRIRGDLEKPMKFEGRQCRFGASFGVAFSEDLSRDGADIQMFANAALYRAKVSGRNRLEFFTPDLHQSLLHDRRLSVEIHEAIEDDQFVPFFQPQISAESGRLVGLEVLLRWRHPAKGLVTPEAFLQVAEQLRLVADIDRIMMEKSLEALGRWRKRGLEVPKISFNVSSGRMHDPGVVALATQMAASNTRVTFELLESILIEEENAAFRDHLAKIRAAGIDIEIDDFGSGHASIIGLMEIAPSALKIDKRIIFPVARDNRARNLVRAIVEIANTLGINTVAEGVETEEQAMVLREIGCNVLQGYLFSCPLSEEQFLSFALNLERNSAP